MKMPAVLFFILITLLGVPALQAAPLKVAVFTGSFDPPHKGHIEAVTETLKNGFADLVIVAANPVSPHKPNMTSYHHRLQMLKLALSGHSQIEIWNSHEFLNAPNNWFAELLLAIHTQFPDAELFQIVGADAIERYQDTLIGDLPLKTGLIVSPRIGITLPHNNSLSEKTTMHYLSNISHSSSTQSKARIQSTRLDRDTPTPVLEYISQHFLYSQNCLENLTK